jgi:hypothetical protein
MRSVAAIPSPRRRSNISVESPSLGMTQRGLFHGSAPVAPAKLCEPSALHPCGHLPVSSPTTVHRQKRRRSAVPCRSGDFSLSQQQCSPCAGCLSRRPSPQSSRAPLLIRPRVFPATRPLHRAGADLLALGSLRSGRAVPPEFSSIVIIDVSQFDLPPALSAAGRLPGWLSAR